MMGTTLYGHMSSVVYVPNTLRGRVSHFVAQDFARYDPPRAWSGGEAQRDSSTFNLSPSARSINPSVLHVHPERNMDRL